MKKNKRAYIALTLSILLIFSISGLTAAQNNITGTTGSVFTTTKDGSDNITQFSAREEVYIKQSTNPKLTPGNYYVRVISPDGKLLGASGGTVRFDAENQKYNLYDITKFNFNPKQKTYKVEVSTDPHFVNDVVKSQNFHIEASTVNDPSIYIEKTGPETAQIGDTITYYFEIINNGNKNLNNVKLTDAKLSLDGVVIVTGNLEPDQTVTYSATYVVPAGSGDTIVNTATVTGKSGNKEVTDSDTHTVNIVQPPEEPEPGITITKSADKDTAQIGDTIKYSFTVQNTGNVDLTNVVITDSDLNWSYTIGNLATEASVTIPDNEKPTYIIPEGEYPNGFLNTATVEGEYNDTKVTDSDTYTVSIVQPPEEPEPGISITKSADKDTAQIGDTIKYSFTVQNTGNVDLTNVVITDSDLNWSYTIGNLATEASVTIPDNEKPTYIIPEGEYPNGFLNTATVEGEYNDTKVMDSDTYTVSIVQPPEEPEPGISITKSANVSSARANDTVRYTITVTNTGNVDLYAVTVTDDKLDKSWGPFEVLAAGEEKKIEDIEFKLPAVPFTNTAIVIGYYGVAANGSSDSVTDEDSYTITKRSDGGGGGFTANPDITITKYVSVDGQTTWEDANSQASAPSITVGDHVYYKFVVKNTGNVTLSELTLTDSRYAEELAAKKSSIPGELAASSEFEIIIGPLTAKSGLQKNEATAAGKYDHAAYSAADLAYYQGLDEVIIPPEEPGTPPEEPQPPEDKEIIVPPELPRTEGYNLVNLFLGLAVAGSGLFLRKRKK